MSEMIRIDLSRSVFDLCNEHAELMRILRELGFAKLMDPFMRHSVGRLMAIPRAAKMYNISMEKIITKLRAYGFEPVEGEKDEQGNQ